LTVVAHPGAKVQRVALLDDGTLGVWVRARAVEGQANTAIERALAAALGLKTRQVKIFGGLANRRKIVEIDLPGLDAVRQRLMARRLPPD
jgi:uncharacterized protein YggU (UPF0235/DUF167 family)